MKNITLEDVKHLETLIKLKEKTEKQIKEFTNSKSKYAISYHLDSDEEYHDFVIIDDVAAIIKNAVINYLNTEINVITKEMEKIVNE